MISFPKYGWCNFDIEDFHGVPSYLTDVALDLINCFIEYSKSGSASAFFDEEGDSFTFVLSDLDAYIIHNSETTTLYRFSKNINELAQELINDINTNYEEWATFSSMDEEDDVINRKIFARKFHLLQSIYEDKPYLPSETVINHSDSDHIRTRNSIFLAGPTKRGYTFEQSWRKQACDYLKAVNYRGVVYVPEHKDSSNAIDLTNQFLWEQNGLDSAGIILFYLNRTFPENPGLTTNVEFGRYLIEKPNKVILCVPDGYDKNNYLKRLYNEINPYYPIYTDLNSALDRAVEILNNRRKT